MSAAHRIRNHLQILASLVDLQLAGTGEPAPAWALRTVRGRLAAVTHLYDCAAGESVDLAHYLADLLSSVSTSWGSERVSITPVFETVEVPFDLALRVGMITNELATNALRHGFPEGRAGTISIQLRVQGEGLLLEIADDGIGMADGAPAEGLGLSIVRDLSRALGATLHLGPSGLNGTHFVLSVPHARLPGDGLT